MNQESKTPRIVRYLNMALIGSLSMLLAEVYSGSSPTWIFSPYSMVVTYTLYLTHILFFMNVAFRFNRTSFEALYFLGVIFGLYEAWITKVIVVGYINLTPILGAFFQIAIAEFLILVFFWHPIMSFMMPLLIYQVLSLSETRSDEYILSTHRVLLKKNKSSLLFVSILTIVGSAVLASYVNYDMLTALLSTISSIAVIVCLHAITKLTKSKYSIHDIKLNKLELTVVIIILVILYLIPFPLMRGEPLASPPTLLIITVVYLVATSLFIRSKVDLDTKTRPVDRVAGNDFLSEHSFFNSKDIYTFFLAFIVLTMMMIATYPFSAMIYLASLLLVMIMGPLLFVRNAVKILRY